MCAKCGEVEQAIFEAFQHIFDSTIELTLVDKAKRLGKIIVQIQDAKLMLNALIQPMTPPDQVSKRFAFIEEIATQFKTMEQEAKTIMYLTTQFWQSIVQDEKLDQLTALVQEDEG